MTLTADEKNKVAQLELEAGREEERRECLGSDRLGNRCGSRVWTGRVYLLKSCSYQGRRTSKGFRGEFFPLTLVSRPLGLVYIVSLSLALTSRSSSPLRYWLMGERRTSDGSVLEPGCLFVETTRSSRAEEDEEAAAGSGEGSPARGSVDGQGADRRIGDTAWGYYPTCE